ncbi:MAG: hypothetical protein STSR0002_14640 [Smithella sp.]|jgi:lipopolysaccharide biosynthesis glycosyltransferase/glycosyltransferase involved in cell wall biosynthesis
MNKEFDKINICFAIDDKYTEHCSVAIVSILKNSSSLFHFFILNSRLNIENKQKIERLKNIKNFNITFIEVKLNHFENCYLPPGSHFSLVNYYRLKIASLLPHLDKVIYLDSDIIANRDLRELWEISLEGYYVGACKAMTYESNSERLGLSTGAPYINSGVLVLNLKKIRKNRIEDKFFDCIKKNPKVIRNVDQDIINLVLLEASDGIKQLRQNWNTEIRTDIPFEKVYLPIISEPYIIHFITGDKPWNPDSKQLYKEKYWEYHKEILMAERWSRESFIIKEYFNDDRTVRQGPFRGMNYSVGKSICSALLPKIYGSYEEPIQKWIQEIINNKYENIINIGCAEGYYAIGLALTSPNSKVYAYDTDAEALLLCKELARSNNVESKIIINDLCTHKELEYFGSKKTIVICDIEGDELHLLDPSLAEGLQYTDIIIEAHDFIADGISETLSDRFKHTHKIEMIVDYEREPKMVLGENINEEILREIIDEKRPVGMKWLRMISLKKYQKQSICSNNYAQESNKYVTQMMNKCVKNKNNNKKGVVYTCITGGYDALVKHTFVDHNWDYVCFTDDLSIGNIDNYSWQIRPLRFDKLDNTRNQRWHKIHPHILFPEYEKSIWLDANINILNEDVFADIDKAIDESCLISIAPHPERNCIYDELIVCAALGKDDEGVMRKQVDLIRSAGFPEKNGLFETNIMYRDHHNYQVIEIMNDWWWWIENFSRRDQLSLSYVLWQHKLKVKPLADISYRYSGGIEFINNTSHVTKEELIVQRDQLQQVLNLRDSKIVDFNQKMQTLTEQLEKRDAERAHILSSTSWKITRPLRFIRSNFINNPYFLFRKLISDSVRKIWITLPLSAHRKISLKNNAFKYLPFLFRWTKAYRDWVAMTGNAVITERDGQITSLRHALDERDEQIAGFNEALSERDAAAALVNRMENSFSWRLTRPLRFIARVYRQWLRADRQRLIKFARRMYHRMPLPFKFKVWLKAVYLKQQTMMDQNTVGSLIQDWNPLLGMAEIAGQYDPSHPWFLVVDLFFPSPDKDSGSVRMSGILSLLREQGFLLTFAADSGEEQNRYRQELQKQGIETLQGYSAIIEHLGQHGGKYRYVVLSRPDIAFRYLPAVRAFALNSEVVYDTVDLHWVRMEREMEISGDYNLKEQVTYYHRIELLNAACSDMVLAITPEEKARLLEEQPDTRVEILPNIHDPLPLVTPFDQRKGLMFIGGFWHKPNEDAVHYFVDQILPLVIAAIPDIVFYIIGSNMPLSIKSLCSKHVEPLGYIADVQPYFSSCRVFVAPLRYGAGMKGKVGQSIAYGLPVVTTTIGAEGMGLVDGQHMLLADTPGAFADAVSRLYFESDLWHRLSANALGHLQKHYSMAATQRRLDAIFPLPEAVRGINAA